jgi:dihydrofolate reductase/thymidylate synthase
MFNVIAAIDQNNGLGFEGKLPWKCPGDLKMFKKLTDKSILIMGRKTVEKLPLLSGRLIITLSRKPRDVNFKLFNNSVIIAKDLEDAIRIASSFCIKKENPGYNKVFIAGGKSIYEQIFTKWKSSISNLYISHIKGTFKCDTYLNINPHEWTCIHREIHKDFTLYNLIPQISPEIPYINLLQQVYHNGIDRKGRNGYTKSLFGKHIEFDLTKGFPLLTTKKMFFRGIIEELLFFIRGQTNTKILEEKRINIWKGNTNREFLDKLGMTKRKEGMMGPMYGYQWRNFNAPYDQNNPLPKGLDQLEKIVEQIRTNPTSRRILITDFNPLQADQGVLYPCHSIIIQFYPNGKFLDMFCYNRSSDLFHGLPFNIASSALFLTLIAKITNLEPRKLIISLGDAHIYESHMKVVKEQIKRYPFQFPTLHIEKDINSIKDIENMKRRDFTISGYKFYPSLKAKMVQ